MGTEQDAPAGAAAVTEKNVETTFGAISQGTVELPCGYVDDEGKVHDQAMLRELTGAEEDILATPKMSGSEKMTRIIGNCLIKLGDIDKPGKEIARKLTIGDRAVLLLAMRSVSLGAVYPFRVKCPSCGAGFHTGVRLEEAPVPRADPAQRSPGDPQGHDRGGRGCPREEEAAVP